ncbi:MAG: alcohol dehydrogenase catalytic domain-containing protein [Anaerolineae bacterium]|nr:alcohol dehydrogenase catalytic domain-containing protein [Anaerolineae bacterium]
MVTPTDQDIAEPESVGEHRETMQALVWTGPEEMVLQDVPLPIPGVDEVLIKVAYCGVCGSELSGYLGHNALRKPPLIMGHEFSGEVVAMGDASTMCNPALSVGARVTVDPMIYDGTCRFCKAGLNHLCLDRQLVGASRPGAFAEYVTVPAHMVFLLPDSLSLRIGALSEPTACAVRIVSLMGNVAGRDILIVGAGAIGLLTLQVLRHRGAGRVFVVDTNLNRLDNAADLGGQPLNPKQEDIVAAVQSATDGIGVAIALDAVGKALTRAQCVAATMRGGRIMLSGLHEETSAVPVADVIRKEQTLQGTFCYTPADMRAAIELLDQHVVTLGDWLTQAPLADGGEWFARLVGDPGSVAKVLLVP